MSGSGYAAAVIALLFSVSCAGAEPAVHPLEATAPPASPHPPAPKAEPEPGRTEAPVVLALDDPRLRESSGLARSTRHPDVLFTHNDKGSGPELFAVDSTGTRAVFTLDVDAVDWEDVASTPDGRLWVADIGDGEGVRSSVGVSVAEEPTVLSSGRLPATTYRFRYPDGAHDAEALLVHPTTFRIHIVTKGPKGGEVYVAPRKLTEGEVHDLRPVAEAPPNVSAGDFAPDGTALVLRSYGTAYYYAHLGDDPVAEAMPDQQQGESVTFDEVGTHVLVGSEGENSKILLVEVPEQFLGLTQPE